MGIDLLTLHRFGRALKRYHVPVLPGLLHQAMRVLYQAYLPYSTEVGEGTRFGYNGMGNVIHAKARIGRGCIFSPHVIVGGRQGLKDCPIIGDYVRIGGGAKILGPVKIGDFAAIGANAVVTHDVPAGAVAAGVPARIIRMIDDPAAEYEAATGLPVPLADRHRAPKPSGAQVVEMPRLTSTIALGEDGSGPHGARAGPTPRMPPGDDDDLFA